jgi:hypothetical protein
MYIKILVFHPQIPQDSKIFKFETLKHSNTKYGQFEEKTEIGICKNLEHPNRGS